MSLAPREQWILADIEDQMGKQEPTLAATFARTGLPSSRRWFPSWFPLSVVHTGLLVLVLLVLVVAYPLALELGTAGVGLLTAAMVVPWMVSVARTGTDTPIRLRKRCSRGPLIKAPKMTAERTPRRTTRSSDS